MPPYRVLQAPPLSGEARVDLGGMGCAPWVQALTEWCIWRSQVLRKAVPETSCVLPETQHSKQSIPCAPASVEGSIRPISKCRFHYFAPQVSWC
jgi:hypothetical protein